MSKMIMKVMKPVNKLEFSMRCEDAEQAGECFRASVKAVKRLRDSWLGERPRSDDLELDAQEHVRVRAFGDRAGFESYKAYLDGLYHRALNTGMEEMPQLISAGEGGQGFAYTTHSGGATLEIYPVEGETWMIRGACVLKNAESVTTLLQDLGFFVRYVR